MPTTLGLDALSWFLLAMRFSLAILFTYSSVGKLVDLSNFVEGVQEYEILTAKSSKFLGIFLPSLELGIGIGMFIGGIYLPVFSFLSFLMLSVFTFAVWISLKRGKRIPCNCYGLVSTELISKGTFVRNIVLLFMTVAVFTSSVNLVVRQSKRRSLS